MPLGKTHEVLCVVCGIAVQTEYSYPERRCGYSSTVKRPEDRRDIHVSCTNTEGNKDCGQGVHYDRYVQLRFEARGTLRATNDGRTNRA